MFLKRLSHLYNVFHTTTKTVLSYSANRGTWKIVQSQLFLKTKDSQVFLQTDR